MKQGVGLSQKRGKNTLQLVQYSSHYQISVIIPVDVFLCVFTASVTTAGVGEKEIPTLPEEVLQDAEMLTPIVHRAWP